MGPHPVWLCPYKREIWTQRWQAQGLQPRGEGSRGRMVAAPSLECLGPAEAGVSKENFPLEPLERAQPGWLLDFGPLAPEPWDKTFPVLNHPVRGTLLWQPRDIHAPRKENVGEGSALLLYWGGNQAVRSNTGHGGDRPGDQPAGYSIA